MPVTPATQAVRRVAVIAGNRIPFARADGPYATASNQDMLTAALNGLAERTGLAGGGGTPAKGRGSTSAKGRARLGEFAAGAVLKHSRDFNLARETVLGSVLDPATPAYDVQQACGTGLQAVFAVAAKIALGVIDCGVAGGADTTSDAPLGVNDHLRRTLLAARRARTLGGRARALAGVRPRHLVPDIPRNAEPRTGLSMGEHAALTAARWGISRQAQDELAATSHQRLAAAYDRGFFEPLVTPYRGLTRDQNLRPDSTPEKLARLRPVYGGPDGTMTAGNSTPLTDGAAVVLLGTPEWAEAHGLEPLAYLTGYETAAVDFVSGDEGLLMAPAYAVPRMLARAGLGLGDFDYYEIHEAFASQVLATLAAWEDTSYCADRLGLDAPLGPVDRARLNVAGSSLATGHPFAATGARIVATLAHHLAAHGGPARGLISICAAGGQGVTAILTRP